MVRRTVVPLLVLAGLSACESELQVAEEAPRAPGPQASAPFDASMDVPPTAMLDASTPADAGRLDGGAWSDSGQSRDGGIDAGGSTSDGGATADGGHHDAGQVDAGDPCAGTFRCDSFETAPLGAVAPGAFRSWTVTTQSATVVVDGTKAHSGQRSLRLDVSAVDEARAFLAVAAGAAFPAAGYHVFARAWLFADQFPADTGTVRHALARLEGTLPSSPTKHAHVESRFDDGRQPYFNYFVNGDGLFLDCAASANTAPRLARQRWVCVEWEFDDVGRTARTWIDGASTPAAEVVQHGTWCGGGSHTQDWVFPKAESFWVGVRAYDPFAFRLFVDDLAMSQTRIGCSTP